MATFEDVCNDAEECGYRGLSSNETMVFIYDKYRISRHFNEDEMLALDEAWIAGKAAYYNKSSYSFGEN